MIENILKDIGLSENEIKIYLALTELGKGTTGEILHKADLNTGKIYVVLNNLKNKGFISEVTEDGVKMFSPSDPQNIYSYIEQKKNNITKQEESLSKIIPQLLSKINSKKSKTNIEIFYGVKGFKSALIKEVKRYKKNETLRIFGVLDKKNYIKEITDHYRYDIYKKRTNSQITVKKIYDLKAKDKSHEKDAKIKYLPYVSPVVIVTIKDLTLIEIITQNQITITIESEEVAKSFIQQFEALWKIAKF